MTEKKVVSQVTEARILIENTRKNPEIQRKLAAFGFSLKNLEQGSVLVEQITMLQRLKKEKYGMQYDATDYLHTEQEAIKDIFEDHRALACIVFKKQRGMKANLGLGKALSRNRAIWSEQVANFYAKIIENHEAMARFAVTKAELEQAQAMVTAFIEAQNQQVEKKGMAQRTTHQRKEAQKKLSVWVKGFKSIARMALADDPELLEYVGIVVPQVK